MASHFMPLVILLMTVLGWADHQQHVKTLHGNNKLVGKTASGLRPDEQPKKTYRDNRKIQKENASLSWEDEMDVNDLGAVVNDMYIKEGSVCHHPFLSIGNGCYLFSDDTGIVDDFAGAQAYCESLSHDHIWSEITLAMLEYDNDEDLALLDAVAFRGKKYWLGGKTQDAVRWDWLDGREVYLASPFWYLDEPNAAQNKCMIAQNYTHDNFERAYLYDYTCSEKLNFICQARNIYCPKEFQHIGNFCYFISEEVGPIGIHHLTWQDSRDYCQSLSVPEGYHVDLAVLGLPDQGDNYRLMTDLVSGYTHSYTWLGASVDSDCGFSWIDGRTIPKSTFYWYYSEPGCGSTERVSLLCRGNDFERIYLYGQTETVSYPFICQMFQDTA